MSMHLRFIDPCAPRAYSDLDDMHGLGGTESTLIRIATDLGRDITVTVEQAARQDAESRTGIDFLPLNLKRAAGDVIVVVNSWKAALVSRKHNPTAQIFVWQHVIPGKHNRVMGRDLAAAGIEILCVSQSHAMMVSSFLSGQVRVTAVPNPISDTLQPDATMRDPDLLFFASSPHKGLDQVAAAFATLRKSIPSLRLEIADPGYLAWDNGTMPEGAESLGTLTHNQVIAKMRQALCIFYPQSRFVETFGLVIAEANAVGCPALVQWGLGANNEVTSTPDQCIDASNPSEILDRIVAWRHRPPVVMLHSHFRQSAIVERWHRLLVRSRISDDMPADTNGKPLWVPHGHPIWERALGRAS